VPGRGRIPGEIGIWVFVLWDMTWFAVLFGVFLDARAHHAALFERSRASLALWSGTLNTFLLLTGSLLVALAVAAARRRATVTAQRLLAFAFACGAGFAVNKVFEYLRLLHAGHRPGSDAFYTYFFAFTGIHLLHLLAGLAVLAFMSQVVRKQVPGRRDTRNLEAAATYWHLVDLLWIALFALLYLLR
jgi:nitric oxide reductase NorE protein